VQPGARTGRHIILLDRLALRSAGLPAAKAAKPRRAIVGKPMTGMEPIMGTTIDNLLTACLQQRASELHIKPGQPPVVRHDGRLTRLVPQSPADTFQTLTPADTFLLMECITPWPRRQEFLASGNADFEFGFGDVCRFRVSVIRARGNVAMVLRQIPTKKWNLDRQG
jgi:Tfp pilus assembly pilus retraction ATPase PilT